MNRWWDDPDAARDILERVDGSDVVQGVGTATLGLHALSRAALAPLAAETLVDATRVQEALEQVDPTPVARAIAAATEPLMGEAAPAYGVMLAAELHAQAAIGAQQMVTQLTAAGVPMPLALERVAHVVGVPAGYAGPFTQAMKGETVSDIVAADAGDRALMTYASAQGHLEVRGDAASPVSKSEFEEQAHPRDEEGRFAIKPGEVGPRMARMARRARRGRRERSQVTQAPQIPQKATLSDLAGLISAPVVERVSDRTRERTSDRTRERTHERGTGERLSEVRVRAQEAPREQAPPEVKSQAIDAPWEGRSERGHVFELDGENAQLIWVHRDTFNEVVRAKGFVHGHLLQRPDTTANHPMSEGEMKRYPPAEFLGGNEMVLLRISGDAPVVEGSDVPIQRGLESVEFAEKARFRMDGHSSVDFDLGDGMVRPVQAIDLVWDNAADFDSWHRQEFHKADEVWEDQEHHQVNRDPHGQFVRQGGSLSPRQARMIRRARRGRRQAAAPAPEQTLVIPAAPSLSELAPLVRADRTRERVSERIRERTRERVEPRAAERTAPEREAEKPDESIDGTTAYQSLRTWTMDESQAKQLLSDKWHDVVYEGRLDYALPTHEDERTKIPFKLHKPSEAADEWKHVGTDKQPDIHYDLTPAAAAQLVRDINSQRGKDLYGPMAYIQPGISEPGTTAVVVPTFDRGTEPVTFIGDPEALEALDRGDSVLQFHLTARNTHELAEAYGADPAVMGNDPVPLVAITVAFLHDEKR